MIIKTILAEKKYDGSKSKYEYAVKEVFEPLEIPKKKKQIKLITTHSSYKYLMHLLEGSDFFYDWTDNNQQVFILKKINCDKHNESDAFLPDDSSDTEDASVTLNIIVHHFSQGFDLPAIEHQIGKYSYDSKNRVLKYNGLEERKVSKIESMILKYLIKNLNNLVTRDLLLQQIWKKNDYFCSRSLDVYISKLRKYISKDSEIKIENIRGAGFRLKVPEIKQGAFSS